MILGLFILVTWWSKIRLSGWWWVSWVSGWWWWVSWVSDWWWWVSWVSGGWWWWLSPHTSIWWWMSWWILAKRLVILWWIIVWWLIWRWRWRWIRRVLWWWRWTRRSWRWLKFCFHFLLLLKTKTNLYILKIRKKDHLVSIKLVCYVVLPARPLFCRRYPSERDAYNSPSLLFWRNIVSIHFVRAVLHLDCHFRSEKMKKLCLKSNLT